MSAISLKIRASSLLLMTASPERGTRRGRGMDGHCRSQRQENPAPGDPGTGQWLVGLEGSRPPSALTAQMREHEAEDSAFLASLDLPCTSVLGRLLAQFALA